MKKTINQVRKKYTNLEKMTLINQEYIEYESRLIYKLDKLQVLNPELVDKVHDFYLSKRQSNWRPNWLK